MVSGIKMKDNVDVCQGTAGTSEAAKQEDLESLVEDTSDLLVECYNDVRRVWIESTIAQAEHGFSYNVQFEGFFELKEPLKKKQQGKSSSQNIWDA